MFRNQYDSDVTVWSPQGRLHQVEYATEAVKQGSATVAVKGGGGKIAVAVALKRAASDLCWHQKKIFALDTHCGVSIAGLLADGRILARFMQAECAAWKWDHEEDMPIKVLNERILLKLQANTQFYGRRPFGVGLLLIGHDSHGAHVIRTEPSAEVDECIAMAIGARAQSARTYLEKNLDQFDGADLGQLVTHALLALRETLPAEEELTVKNTSIAMVGANLPFATIEDKDTEPYLQKIVAVPRARQAPGAQQAEPEQAGEQPPGSDERMDDAPPQ